MDDKRIKDKFNNIFGLELRFTKEDRNEVFEQINKMENNNTQKKSLVFPKKIVPITVSLLLVGLCLFLFLPSILLGNFNEESNSNLNNESSTTIASDPVIEEAEILTTLITVKSKDWKNDIYLNLLLSYSKDKKMMKVVSLPYATYAPVAENDDGTTLYDKLLFAYNYGGAKNVRTTVSKFFDIPIDYYAVIDLQTISTLIDSMNGIDYDLQEDMRLRAISQVAFEFKKGTNHLNGEQIISLMMAAGTELNEDHLLNLMNIIMDRIENKIPATQLKELLPQIETNVSLDQLLDNQIENNSITLVSLSDGMIADSIILSSTTGKFIYRFEKDFLNSISEELTTFN